MPLVIKQQCFSSYVNSYKEGEYRIKNKAELKTLLEQKMLV